MKQKKNLISERNALSKDFQQWKQLRTDHLQSTLREFEAKSLFYQFPQKSSSFSSASLLKSPYLPTKLRNAENLTRTSTTTTQQGSTFANFRQTIISDSLQQNDHLLNRIGQNPDQGPFVPYINERDKLGRLVKEENYQAETKQIQDRGSHLELNGEVNANDERSSQNENQGNIGTPWTPETPSLADDQLEKQQFSRETNRKRSKQHWRGKSSSQLQTPSLLPSPQQKQQRSASTLIDQESLSQQHLKLSELAWHEEKPPLDSRRRIASLLNVEGSNKLHGSSCFQNSNYNDSFFGKTSSLQTTIQESIHSDNSQTKPKTSNVLFRPKRNSFTQLISWNYSQPPSPTRILISLPHSKQSFTSKQTKNNNNNKSHDTHNQDIPKPSSNGFFLFDKNNHLKQIGSDFKNRTFAFNEKHMLSRTKKLQSLQQSQIPLSKEVKHRGVLKLPESVQQSPFFRVLFNHHKKIQAFNKMIDRNEFITLQDQREDEKEDSGDTQTNGENKNQLENTQNQQKQTGFITSKKKNNQLTDKQEYVLQASGGADDGVQPFKNRLFKSVKSKYQKEEEERQMKQNIFKEYDKWYTKQMYYQELDD